MKVSIIFPGSLSFLSKSYSFKKNMCWDQLLLSILNSHYQFLINPDGSPKNYVLLYLNDSKVKIIKNLKINNNDSLIILTAVSGG